MELHNLSFEEYDDIPAWNWSKLKHAHKSAAHAAQALKEPNNKDSENVILGRAVHCLVLTPERFEDEFYVHTPVDKRTAAGKQAHAEALERAGNRTLLSSTLHSTAIGMAKSITTHPIASEILMNAKTEVVFTWDYNNVALKARADIVGENEFGLYIADIKTCDSAHCLEFPRYARKMMYPEQVVFYSLGVENNRQRRVESKYIIAVERNEPYCVAVYSMCSDTESAALEVVMKCCDTVAMWADKDTSSWDGYPTVYYTL